MKRGWRKPEHLTWHQVEHWLYRPENRYRGPAIQQGNLADMLNAHLRPWPAPAVPPQADTGGTPPGTRRSNAATGADHSQRPRHRRDTVHVRPHRAHLTWLNQATPPTLPPGNPLRRNNRLLALYSGNGRWDLRVILAPPRGDRDPSWREASTRKFSSSRPTRWDMMSYIPPSHAARTSRVCPKTKVGPFYVTDPIRLAHDGDRRHQQEPRSPPARRHGYRHPQGRQLYRRVARWRLEPAREEPRRPRSLWQVT